MKIAIIGGGLTGLSLTHWFHKHNHDVVLLEAKDTLGGRFRAAENSEVLFVQPSEAGLQTLEWLKNLSPLGFSWRSQEHQPLRFESAEWRPFLGFGDFDSDVVDELSFFNQSEQWLIEPGLEQITRSLIENLPVVARTMSEVTGFEWADGKIQSAIINAQEKLAADHFIFTPSPHLLNGLIVGEGLTAAHRSRLVKQPAWTAVSLSLRHATPIDSNPSIRLILGSGKEFQPVVGRVWPTHSVWLNLISNDLEEDLEHTGDSVRFIKRTLKRVWPELLELVTSEKIRVRPQAYGHIDLKLKTGFSFPELSNLHFGDGRLSDVAGDLSTAAIARQLAVLFIAEHQNPVLIDSEANQ